METKKYIVMGHDDGHEFNIVTNDLAGDGIQYLLYASNTPIWSEHMKGTLLLAMTDTGNNLTFEKEFKVVGYDVLACMRVLIEFNQAQQPENTKVKYRVYEKNLMAVI